MHYIISLFLILTTSIEAHYVWNLRFAIDADISPMKGKLPFNYITGPSPAYNDPSFYIKDTQPGDIIWVQSSQLTKFYEEVFPTIEEPFILVINDGIQSFPLQRAAFFDVNTLINDPKVLHIFTQNYDYPTAHPKITPIPLGLDFHTIAHSTRSRTFGENSQTVEQQEAVLNDIISKLKPTYQRKKRAYVDWHLSDRGTFNGENRTRIFNQLWPTRLVDAGFERVPRRVLWQTKGEYAFSISPRGAGLDCHRTWEDLALGCIVIVKTSTLDPLYEGLPVVIVKDWSEVNKKNFDLWFNKYKDAFTNPDYRKKLTHAYWMNLIRSKKI